MSLTSAIKSFGEIVDRPETKSATQSESSIFVESGVAPENFNLLF